MFHYSHNRPEISHIAWLIIHGTVTGIHDVNSTLNLRLRYVPIVHREHRITDSTDSDV